MRFEISTHLFKCSYSQKLQLKTSEIKKAYEIARFFLISSGSCVFRVWNEQNRTKIPNINLYLDKEMLESVLTNENLFLSYVVRMLKKR